MKKIRNKGFTLIELLAVIVILAILALIVTPIVLNIIEKAQENTDERSLARYAEVVKQGYFESRLDNSALKLEDYLSSSAVKELNYTGSEVLCEEYNITTINDIELLNCTVDGRGYYNYKDGKASKGEDLSGSINTKKYENGEVVYFDVVNGVGCTEDEYKLSWNDEVNDYLNSLTGYNGTSETATTTGTQNSCLKFYAFNDTEESDTVNLLLDHNTTNSVYWSNSDYIDNGPNVLLPQLQEDTIGWNDKLQASGSEYGYEIDYSGYKARLITAQEIAQITENTTWSETPPSDKSVKFTEYKWLYDRTTECGYWTVSTALGSSGSHNAAWEVTYKGNLFNKGMRNGGFSYDTSGVRPVITVLKSNL